jgi:hypothetical protein
MTAGELGRIPDEEDARLIYLSHAFGRLFFDVARTPAHQRAQSLPESVRTEVESIVDDALFAVLGIVDGFYVPIRNDELSLEFALIARVRVRANGEAVDEVELAPDGEDLQIGFHSWLDGDFGDTPDPLQTD